MKIVKIEEESGTFIVTTEHRKWFKKFIEVRYFKPTRQEFVYGGGAVYIEDSGEELLNLDPIGKAIDTFRNKQKFWKT